MSDLSRRDWLKVVGVAGVAAAVPLDAIPASAAPPVKPIYVAPRHAAGDIIELYSTSDVFIPPKGRSWMKFSFDFPEPGVAFGDHRFSFLVFTNENTYSLDRSRMKASGNADALEVTCDRFVWAGGQETAPGSLHATFTRKDGVIEWSITAETDKPIKTITTVIRDVPRGNVSLGGGQPQDTRDGDVLGGYTFGAGDLHNEGVTSMSTPIAMVQVADNDFLYITTLDNKVRPKRYYFQAGEKAFRVEAIYEHDAWRNDKRVEVPKWRMGHATSLEGAMQLHMAHIESSFGLQPWETRTDVPAWMRNIALVTTLHGEHYTWISSLQWTSREATSRRSLRWMATQIPPERVLVFLSSWDGRYYWDYPNYKVPARMGGEAGFRRTYRRSAENGLQDDADVRHQRGEPESTELAEDCRGCDAQDRGRSVRPELGGLEQRPSPGRLAHVHEPWRRCVAQSPRGADRGHHRALRRGRLLP